METVPEYLSANVERAAARILALPIAPSFIFTTDFHARDNTFVSVSLMKYLHEKTGVRRVFCGGDFPYAFGSHEDCVRDTVRSLSYLETLKHELERYAARGNRDITIHTSWEEKTGYAHPESETNRLLMSANSPPCAEFLPCAERTLHFEDGGEGWSVVAFGHVPCSEKINSGEACLAPLAELFAAFRHRRLSLRAQSCGRGGAGRRRSARIERFRSVLS